MTKNYQLSNGEIVIVDSLRLGDGGEGEVFDVLSPFPYTHSVAKILYPDKRTHERRYKIRYMIDHPPANTQDENGHDFLIWPQQILFDNGEFVGFLMPKAEGIDLDELCRSKLKPELDNIWQKFDRQSPDALALRLILCSNISKAIRVMHSSLHYVIGDLKPENIKVKSNGLVSILDLDSCQISDGGQIRFQSKMNTPKYNPPDNIADHKETSWDLFIVGIIYYEILCGIHPFTGTTSPPYDKLNTPELKIPHGLFPFGSKGRYFQVVGGPHSNFQNLSDKIQNLFIDCFDNGISNRDIRPTTSQWIDNLTPLPEIDYFKSDRDILITGMEAEFSWSVTNADRVFIDGLLDTTQNFGTIRFKPRGLKIYKLRVSNKFGTAETELELEVFPTPIIESLFITVPEFSCETLVLNLSIGSPRLELGIELDSALLINNSVPMQTYIETHQFSTLLPSLKRPISEVFDYFQLKIKEKLKTISFND